MPRRDASTYTALSPVYRAPRIRAPMLLAVGDEEGIPFIGAAMDMYTALRRLGRPVALVHYRGPGHGLEGWAERDLAARTRRFLGECLEADGRGGARR